MGKLDDNIKQLENVKQLTESEKIELIKDLRKVNLLTEDISNSKTLKSGLKYVDYKSYIMHLSPAGIAYDYLNRRGTVCPNASAGCESACLNTAGRGKFNSVQRARLRKTLYYINFKAEFMSQLDREIKRLRLKSVRNNQKLVIRLNGTSDIPFEKIKVNSTLNIFENNPFVKFYDYTKSYHRLKSINSIINYNVTFSASESNHKFSRLALKSGVNVAMVFNSIPESYKGFIVINGDEHDLRFMDKQGGYIVGLSAKGDAKKDNSGFIRIIKESTAPIITQRVIINSI